MRGVILEGDLGAGGRDESTAVLVFLELEDGHLHVRRTYGERAAVVTFELDAVEAALAALKHEANRRPPAEPEASA